MENVGLKQISILRTLVDHTNNDNSNPNRISVLILLNVLNPTNHIRSISDDDLSLSRRNMVNFIVVTWETVRLECVQQETISAEIV